MQLVPGPPAAQPPARLPPIVARVKGILARPATEWAVIAAENTGSFDVVTRYAVPLAGIGAIALFVGQVAIGLAVPMIGIVRASVFAASFTAVILLVLSVLLVLGVAVIVNLLAPRFGGERNASRAIKLAAYSHTPLWLAGIAYAIPWVGFLWILGGLYSIYVAALGMPAMMRCPKERAPAYAIAGGLCGLVLFAIVGSTIAALTGFGPNFL